MAETKFTSYDEVLKSGLIGDVLYLVISNKGTTKTYKDLLPLDGGTVGIASFAVGGLEILYKNMNTQTYFGKTEKEMIESYSTKCRPAGKSGDDNGWGCYSQKFWYDGMKLFLDSPDSKSIQEKAWSAKMKVDIEEVIKKGWTTKRQIAIALSISNSLGIGGMKSIADSNKWDAEKTLQNYASKSENNEKRRKLIDENFPFVKNVETTNEPNNTPTSNTPSTPVNSIAEDKVETPKGPDFPEDKIFTFNVENSKFLVSAEIGTFSVVPINPEFDFFTDEENIPLDDEYYEGQFTGQEELTVEIQMIRAKETSEEIDKNLSDSDKIGSDVATQGGSIKLGDDADFWSLIAICSLEDGDDQARADIAQSIYNRVGSKIYSSSIKKAVTAKWQYEPAFKKGAGDGTVAQEWKDINSKETAIKAIIYTKGWSRETALAALKKCFEALRNLSYQKEASKFIAGRTDFLSENQGLPAAKNKKNPSKKAIMRDSGRPNNVFAWNYNYKANKVYDPPSPDWFNKYANKF